MILKQYLTELFDERKILAQLKGLSPTQLRKMNQKLLLEYHRKTHMLYSGNIKRRNKEVVNMIVEWHDMIVNEMLRRKINHNSPLVKI